MSTQTMDTKVEEKIDSIVAIRQYEGRVVKVKINHSTPIEMLCAGVSDSLCLFIDSISERLNGQRVINGIRKRDFEVEYIGAGFFKFPMNCTYPYEITKKGLGEEDYQRVMRLWKARKR
ncbi:MAG: hypothetical protein AABX54_04335 [Nanoarchaeota archaeon]